MQWIAKLSRTHFIVAFVALLAFASTFSYLQSLDKKISVATLSRDINSGETISTEDIEYVNVSFDDTISAELISSDDLAGKKLVARTDLSSTDLLTKTNTVRRSTPQGLQSLSIGIEIDRANGGDIRKGDTINIWRTGEENGLVAKSISVRSVILPNKRLGISTTKTITIVVAVSPTQAQNLSRVIGSKDIMIVLANGTENLEGSGEDEQVIPLDSGFQPLEISQDTKGLGE